MAGILWKILPSSARRRTAGKLTLHELQSLNDAWKEHISKKNTSEKAHTELLLLQSLRPGFPLFFKVYAAMLSAAALLLIVIHFLKFPGMQWNLRIGIYSPVLMGLAAPLLLAVLPPYRIRLLFRFRLRTESIVYLFAGFAGTLWTMALIRMTDQQNYYFRPDMLSFIILFTGAVTAPLLEEVFFRELLPGVFSGSWYWAGHLLSACVFSAAHLPSGAEMAFYYTVAGLLLSSVRILTGGLLYPFLIHAAVNGIMVSI